MEQVFLTENFGFPKPITIPPVLHVHSSLFLGMDNSQSEAAVATKSHPITTLTKRREIFFLYLELWSLR
jgi:hypothetical protein